MASEDEDLFSNDGNFLERFKKLEEERKRKEEETNAEKTHSPPGTIIPTRRKNMKPHPLGNKKSKGALRLFLVHQSSLYYE